MNLSVAFHFNFNAAAELKWKRFIGYGQRMRFQLENVYDVFVLISFERKLFALNVVYG